MPPTACVDVGALPLQLLLRRRPEWRRRPAAVVTEDKPLGTIVAVNRPAQAVGVRVGMRYATALSLAAHLQAATVAPEEIAAGVATIRALLLTLSPRVEWAGDGATEAAAGAGLGAGVFWLETAGLHRLYRSPAALAAALQRRLRAARFRATVALGYTRMGTCILAQQLHRARSAGGARRGWLIAPDAAAEQAAACRAPLERLPLEPPVRDLLEQLGVVTVGHFLRLPYGQLLGRFGPRVAAVHRAGAGGAPEVPVQTPAPAPRFLGRRRLEPPAADAGRLLGHCTELLDGLLAQLRAQEQAVVELELRLLAEDGTRRCELVRPAAPTHRRQRLLELLALRLRGLELTAGVEELTMELRYAPLPTGQGALFATRQRRDPAAAAEALARIRAEFGNRAVRHAVLVDAHLPEAQFRWQIGQIAGGLQPLRPAPAAAGDRQPLRLVRRLGQPRRIPAPGAGAAPARPHRGPFLISSGWWLPPTAGTEAGTEGAGGPADRAYYVIRAPRGALEWIYYDRLTGLWYRQGWVE